MFRPLVVVACALFMLFVSLAHGSMSIVADLDSNATNGPDTLLIEPTDTVLVHLWFTGDDSIGVFGVTIGDTSGVLSWVEEADSLVYGTPAGWTDVSVSVDSLGWILLQSTDFAFSNPIHGPYRFAQLKFFVTPGDSCGSLDWNPEMSGWFELALGESSYSCFQAPAICVDSLGEGYREGGGESSGGEAGTVWGGPEFADSLNNMFCDYLGNPVDYAGQIEQADYIPGEVIVWFHPDSVRMPSGREEEEVAPDDMVLSADVAAISSFLSVQSFAKVFPQFGETNMLSEENATGERMRKIDLRNAFVLAFSANQPMSAVVDSLHIPSVIWAEPNYLYRPAAVPNDPLLSSQWPNHPGGGDYIGMEEAWSRTTGSDGLRMGFVDTGVLFQHPDLGGWIGSGYHFAGGYDFYDEDTYPFDASSSSHGTKVAGVATALSNNELGISGVVGGWMPDSMGVAAYAFRVTDESGIAPASVLANALQIAADPLYYGCDIILCGLTGSSNSLTLAVACANAQIDNSIVVCPRGNAGSDAPSYPGSFQWTISVGATTSDAELWDSSSYGGGVDLVAPGENIMSTSGTNSYDADNGTSLACAYAAGAAAMVISNNPVLSGAGTEAVRAGLWSGSIDLGDSGYDEYHGFGRIAVDSALSATTFPRALKGPSVSASTPIAALDYLTSSYFIFHPGPDGYLSGLYYADLYRLSYTFQNLGADFAGAIPFSYTGNTQPHAESTGWTPSNPNIQMRYRGISEWSDSTATQVTYFYQVWTVEGFPIPLPADSLGWFPYDPTEEPTKFILGYWGLDPCVDVEASSIDTREIRRDLMVLPNPVRESALFSINAGDQERALANVYDIRGRVIAEVLGHRSGHRIEFPWNGRDAFGRQVPSGTYFVKVQDDGGETHVRKVRVVR